MIHETTDANFETEVLDSSVPCVILFTAGYCTYCDDMVPRLEQIQDKYEGSAKFCIVNTDHNRQLRIAFAVAAVPYIVMVKDGQYVPLFDMIVPTEQLDERVGFAVDGGECPVVKSIRWKRAAK